MNLLKIINKAKQVAKLSDHPNQQLGAVIFDKKGRILSVGHNWHTKTHPVISRINELKTMHAECHAILGCRHKYDLTEANIFVYRELKNKQPALAKPCELCMKVIKLFGIKKIWYTTGNAIEVIKL